MDPTVRLDRCSEPSVSVNAALIDSAIALSSLPVAGAAVTVGAEGKGLRVTSSFGDVESVGLCFPSCKIAVTVKAKSTSESARGVTVRLPRFQPRTLIDLWLASSFFFKDTATTEIYTLSLPDALPIWCSEPSVSVNAALIDSAIALSSLPVAGATVTVG